MTRFLPFVLLALVGCDAFSGPDFETRRVLGQPALSSLGVEPLAIPDTVTAGEPFEVTVTTAGGGCHVRADGVEVDAGGEAVEFRPYDIVRVPVSDRAACTLPLLHFPRTAVVVMAEPGRRLLRVVGGSGPDPTTSPVVVERVVVVLAGSSGTERAAAGRRGT